MASLVVSRDAPRLPVRYDTHDAISQRTSCSTARNKERTHFRFVAFLPAARMSRPSTPNGIATRFATSARRSPSLPRPRRPSLSSSHSFPRNQALPLHSGHPTPLATHHNNDWLALVKGRLRKGKSQLIILAILLLLSLLYVLAPATTPHANNQSTRINFSKEQRPLPHSSVSATPIPPLQVPIPTPNPPLVTPSAPSPPIRPFDISVRPTSVPIPPSSNEKFLAYSPHSGYHNQRISLENALTLAFMLRRTLLLPPVWLGHAIPYISFDKLQRRLQMANKAGLERCREMGEGGSDDPIPRECEGYFDWTLVHWDFLVDLKVARSKVTIRDRWNQTQEALVDELGLRWKTKASQGDVFDLKEDKLYQYRIYDDPADVEPLGKYENCLDTDRLADDTRGYKLLNIGTLFGTARLRVTKKENGDARSAFRRAMVFRNEMLDEITERISNRLGGAGNYYGLHLRVGDGVFQADAGKNMKEIWRKLCVEKMKLESSVCESVGAGKLSRFDDTAPPPPSRLLTKRANSQPQAQGAYHHPPLPPLPVIRTRKDSLLDSTLTCRGRLHAAVELLPFNAPLFIATDAKIPTSNPHLAVFFAAFPCTFILSDFDSVSPVNSRVVEGLNQLAGLRNIDDKVPLAQFLYPQLDAQLAAYGRGLIGTPQSTYSRFAVDVLHQVYQ